MTQKFVSTCSTDVKLGISPINLLQHESSAILIRQTLSADTDSFGFILDFSHLKQEYSLISLSAISLNLTFFSSF
jgi:hypothetical protein